LHKRGGHEGVGVRGARSDGERMHGAAVGEGGEHGAGLEQEGQREGVRANPEAREEEEHVAQLALPDARAEERIGEPRGRDGDFVEQVAGEAWRVGREDVAGEVVRGVEVAGAEEVGVQAGGGERG
jgi:hypothetical protein